MVKKNVRELRLVQGRSPAPTIEIQADSLDRQGLYLGQIVSRALADHASKHVDSIATVHALGGMSVTFHVHAWSEFLIVAGDAKVLQAISAALARHPGVDYRHGEDMLPREGRPTYHVEHGRLWEVEDALTWYSADSLDGEGDDEGNDAEDEDIGEDEDSDDNSLADVGTTGPVRRAGRMNAARADARVSTIRRQIEKVFGLPEGSVALCGPDKKPMKGSALIKTLRSRWPES